MAPNQIGVDAVLPVHSGRHMLSDRRARNGLTKARQPRKELVVSYQNEGKTRSPVCRRSWHAARRRSEIGPLTAR
jgi:hypothetical protein